MPIDEGQARQSSEAAAQPAAAGREKLLALEIGYLTYTGSNKLNMVHENCTVSLGMLFTFSVRFDDSHCVLSVKIHATPSPCQVRDESMIKPCHVRAKPCVPSL